MGIDVFQGGDERNVIPKIDKSTFVSFLCMVKEKDNSIRNNIIGTVIGGLLLAFLLSWVFPSVSHFLHTFWGYITSTLSFLGNLIASDYSIPGWVFLFLGILSIPTLIRLTRQLGKPTAPQAKDHYLQDTLFGTTWRWTYGYNAILNLWCFCPHCDMELVFKEVHDSPHRGIFDTLECTEFICDRCQTTRAKIEGEKNHALAKVEREIRRKIRTGEWQSVVKK